MPISGVLKNFRQSGYGGGDAPADDSGASSPGPRSIKLTGEELKDLQGYGEPGQEQECLVTGRVGENGEFTVTSVRSTGGDDGPAGPGDENDMASQVMGMMGKAPMVQNQTMPSPS